MALDRVLPIGCESTAEGGTQNYKDLTAINPSQDALPAAGFFVEGPDGKTNDRKVLLDRSGTSMRLQDGSTTRLLSELMTSVAGATNAHSSSRDVQHFLAGEGPGDGFASGSYLQRNFSGQLLTSEVWYTSSAQTVKIIGKVYAYGVGAIVPSTITYTMYSATGAAIRTVVDSLTYTGTLCTGISRTWS